MAEEVVGGGSREGMGEGRQNKGMDSNGVHTGKDRGKGSLKLQHVVTTRGTSAKTFQENLLSFCF